jgi:hypothetical protein
LQPHAGARDIVGARNYMADHVVRHFVNGVALEHPATDG